MKLYGIFDEMKLYGIFDEMKLYEIFDEMKLYGIFDEMKLYGIFDEMKLYGIFDGMKYYEIFDRCRNKWVHVHVIIRNAANIAINHICFNALILCLVSRKTFDYSACRSCTHFLGTRYMIMHAKCISK